MSDENKQPSADRASYLGQYQAFQGSEQHFNEVQAGIRKLASTWMLAALGGVAYVLHSDETTVWLVEPLLLVTLLASAASVGMLVLYILDQLLYQRLLNAVFVMAAYWEFRDKSLPVTRLIMRNAKKRGMSQWVIWYYSVPMYLFFIISVAAMLRTSPCKWTWIWGVALGLQVVAYVILYAIKNEVRTLKNAEKFDDKAFTAFFDVKADPEADLKSLLAGRDFGQSNKWGGNAS